MPQPGQLPVFRTIDNGSAFGELEVIGVRTPSPRHNRDLATLRSSKGIPAAAAAAPAAPAAAAPARAQEASTKEARTTETKEAPKPRKISELKLKLYNIHMSLTNVIQYVSFSSPLLLVFFIT